MQKAVQSRRIGETKMNKHSSRSHCIFTVSVYAKRYVADGSVDYHGKLHLVDLAGSECAKNAGMERASEVRRIRTCPTCSYYYSTQNTSYLHLTFVLYTF